MYQNDKNVNVHSRSLFVTNHTYHKITHLSKNQRIVLYKEKNMLMTESELCRRHSEYFPQPERRQKVKKSMAAIKQVLGERKRQRISNIMQLQETKEKEEETESL